MVAPLAQLALSAATGVAKGIANSVAKGVADTLSGTAGSGAPEAKAGAEAKAKKTANDFETMFLEDVLERMTAGLGEDGPLGDNGTGGSVYRSMLVKEYADGIVKSGGIGLSKQVMGEMLRLQEGGGRPA